MIGGDAGRCTYSRDKRRRFPCIENRGKHVKAVAAEYDLTQCIETSHTLVTKLEMIPMEFQNQNL